LKRFKHLLFPRADPVQVGIYPSETLKFIGNEKAETFRFLEKKMDATILAIIQSRPDYKLSLEDIAVADAYVKDNKTADLLALGEANSANTKTYHDCRQRLTDHSDYFGAVWNLFNRLPRGGLVDGCAKWSRWQESNFKAYKKNQQDYITKIAKAAVLRLRGEEPEKKEKKNYKTLALDLARMVLNGDRDGAEKLAQQIVQDSGKTTEKAEYSAFFKPAPKSRLPKSKMVTTHVFGLGLTPEAGPGPDNIQPLKHHRLEIT
jgi:hypothetical protein